MNLTPANQRCSFCRRGHDEVERLIAEWGGLPLSVPLQPSPSHPIPIRAGPGVARELSRMYGGERVNMPIGAVLVAEQRRRQVAYLKRAGLNHTEIARRLGLPLLSSDIQN